MKEKYKSFPVMFLIFGVVLIALVSGSSISKYVKTISKSSEQSNNASAEVGKNENTNTGKNNEEEKLFFNKPETMPAKTLIKVYKGKNILELYGDEKLIGRFKIGLGRDPWSDKEKEGDNRTPEGTYYVCSRTGETKYTYFIGLSYPNIKDAEKGLQKGIINQATYNRIKKAIDEEKQPPWNTPLGGAIGIHGGGNKSNWTTGCIAMSNEDISILKQYAPIKTQVEIYK